MIPQLKAEFKKLLSVRSTLIVSLLIIFLTLLFTYLNTSKVYDEALDHPAPSQSTEERSGAPGASDKNQQQNQVVQQPKLTNNLPANKVLLNLQDSLYPTSLLITIVVILLMAHEFRYNTITYTLTSSNSRTRVLVAKIIVGTIYATIMTIIAISATVAATYFAINIRGLNLPQQNIDWIYIGGRLVGYSLGFALLGLAAITLLRNQVAGIVAVFLLPTLDAIGAGILTSKSIEPAKYLPFSALTKFGNIVDNGSDSVSTTSITRAGIVFVIYLVVVWLVTWYLFLKRDAT
ncbi:ABC transporter permease subunit [Candidatus Saccharibacteria bacterium]|nr:ABC transporter permease subunit [Candidatus Saccharibacteria bacterium]